MTTVASPRASARLQVFGIIFLSMPLAIVGIIALIALLFRVISGSRRP